MPVRIGDEAPDPRLDLNFLDRLEPSGEFIPIGDGALGRLGDGYRRRRRCCGLRGGPVAARDAYRKQDRQRWKAAQRLKKANFLLS